MGAGGMETSLRESEHRLHCPRQRCPRIGRHLCDSGHVGEPRRRVRIHQLHAETGERRVIDQQGNLWNRIQGGGELSDSQPGGGGENSLWFAEQICNRIILYFVFLFVPLVVTMVLAFNDSMYPLLPREGRDRRRPVPLLSMRAVYSSAVPHRHHQEYASPIP